MADDIPRCLLLVFLVLFAGFFTGSETALSYCNRIRIKTFADDGKKSAIRASYIFEHFDKALVTLLICINIIYISSASLATLIAIKFFDDAVASVVASAVMTLSIFIFSETIPKNFAKANCDEFALAVSAPIMILMKILTPVSIIFTGFGNLAKKILGTGGKEPSITEDEFQSIVESVGDEGVIEPEETEIIQSAVEFADLTVSEAMTPRESIVAVDRNDSYDKIKATLLSEKYSRVPVYKGDIDHIVGILQASNFMWSLLNESEFDISRSMTQPYYIHPDMKLDTLFEEMGRKRTHIAVVVAATREKRTLGVITMEDILEQLVGEIYDEDDAVLPPAKKREAAHK